MDNVVQVSLSCCFETRFFAVGEVILYQRADVRVSGLKFIEGETIVVSVFISSIVEDHAAVQSMGLFVCCREERIERAAASSRRLSTYALQRASHVSIGCYKLTYFLRCELGIRRCEPIAFWCELVIRRLELDIRWLECTNVVGLSIYLSQQFLSEWFNSVITQGGSEWKRAGICAKVQFLMASKVRFVGSALSKTLRQGLPPTNWGYSPFDLFEPPVNFLLPSSSAIERLAIPVATFSLFPFETPRSPTYDHDDDIPNSTIYVSRACHSYTSVVGTVQLSLRREAKLLNYSMRPPNWINWWLTTDGRELS